MKPIPGKTYTTIEGDTPARIAGQAYGNPAKANLIQNANDTQTPLSSTSTFPTGINILIPLDPEFSHIRKRNLRRGLGYIEPGG
jgi:hypothetical protein